MSQRYYVIYLVVNVVVVQINKQYYNSRNSCLENFKWQVFFDGKVVVELVVVLLKVNQVEYEKVNDFDKQNVVNCEQNFKKFVVNWCVGVCIDGEKVDVLVDLQVVQSKDYFDY